MMQTLTPAKNVWWKVKCMKVVERFRVYSVMDVKIGLGVRPVSTQGCETRRMWIIFKFKKKEDETCDNYWRKFQLPFLLEISQWVGFEAMK